VPQGARCPRHFKSAVPALPLSIHACPWGPCLAALQRETALREVLARHWCLSLGFDMPSACLSMSILLDAPPFRGASSSCYREKICATEWARSQL